MIPPSISFIIVIIIILILSKKELGLVLTLAAVILAFLTGVNLVLAVYNVFTDLSIILLLIVVSLIPILGGIMDDSGLMMESIKKMSVSKKSALMITPALFGLLPVAGGALMSAPIVDQIDNELDSNRKIAINVWFRHILIFIYPLSVQLIVGSVLANLPLYNIIIALILPNILMILIGYFFLVRSIDSQMERSMRDLKKALYNMIPIIIAPIIDFIGRTFFNFILPEFFLIIGLSISIIVALSFSHYEGKDILRISKKMKIWRFPLIIFAIFLFLEVFLISGVPQEISSFELGFIFFLSLGFFLGFSTGRVQLPLSIIIPIYLIQNGLTAMFLLDFVLLYWIIFLGYLITPIHPCLAYSINYFKMNYKGSLRFLFLPTAICIITIFTVYGIYLLF